MFILQRYVSFCAGISCSYQPSNTTRSIVWAGLSCRFSKEFLWRHARWVYRAFIAVSRFFLTSGMRLTREFKCRCWENKNYPLIIIVAITVIIIIVIRLCSSLLGVNVRIHDGNVRATLRRSHTCPSTHRQTSIHSTVIHRLTHVMRKNNTVGIRQTPAALKFSTWATKAKLCKK